jgi:hypothetical protein
MQYIQLLVCRLLTQFLFIFKSTIYNAVLERSPQGAHNTNSAYSKTTLHIAHYYTTNMPQDLLLAGKHRPKPTNIPRKRCPFER